MKNFVTFIILTISFFTMQSQDWENIPVPVDPGTGNVWELQTDYSDDFNYNGKGAEFQENWNDHYHNGWDGPGLTEFNSDHSDVVGGDLVIRASRKSGTNKVFCGVITSKTKVKYPIYLEARIKASNQVLSSNFWMLSQDDAKEIDVLEVYGGDRPDQTWFAKRMSTNYHIFERDGGNNIIADHNAQHHVLLPGEEPWRNDYHRFGVYWKSPTEITFYINGVEENTFTDGTMTDPSGDYINREMFMIIDTEDHSWRSDQGIVATDAELEDESKNKMFVDWIRVYKPVEESLSVSDPQLKTFSISPNPVKNVLFLKDISPNILIRIFDYAGRELLKKKTDSTNSTIDVSNFQSGIYLVRAEGYQTQQIIVN